MQIGVSELSEFALRKKRKPVVLDDAGPGLKPAGLVAALSAGALGSMIVFNAFFGQVENAATLASLEIPEGATTRATVTVPGKSSRIVTLKYDEDVEDVQRELAILGYFQGGVDGVNGPQTQQAIARYQSENQLDVTGDASRELLEHIRYTRKITQASRYTGSVAAVSEDELVSMSQSSLALSAAAPPVPRKAPVPKPTADAAVRKAQVHLKRLGYDAGPANGQMSDATRSAILTYQMDNGLAMDGQVNKQLLVSLLRASASASAQ